jgi:zinc transport system ATP-binding protein
LLRCRQLRVGYGGRAILPPIDLELRPGQLWAVVGRNGSGKTTWFRSLLGLLPVVAGSIERSSELTVSYVPQRSQLDPLFPALVREVVAMGELRGWSLLRSGAAGSSAVGEALRRTATVELAGRPFRELSEGQKQRVLVARVLVARPRLALLDEPTSAMDRVAEREALATLDRLRREHGTCVLVVSHALGRLRELADHTVLFDAAREQVLVGATRDVQLHAAFQRNYAGEAEDVCEAPEP